MDWFSLRVCRHCRKSVGFDDKVCKHCKHKLMSPTKYRIVLFAMIATIVIVYGALFYAYWELRDVTCKKADFYQRATAPEGTSCNDICTLACQQKDKGAGTGVLLTEGRSSDSVKVTLSCVCTCNRC